MGKKVTTRFKEGLPRHFVKEWRNHRGYTGEQLAELAGVSQGLISQLEKGSTAYTQQTLEALATALFCSPADLIARPPEANWGLDELVKDMGENDRATIIEMVKTFAKSRAA